MRAPAIIRVALLALTAAVIGLVYMQWDSGAEDLGGEPPAPAPGPDGAVSLTSGLQYTAIENGFPIYHLRAGQRLGFADNRSEFGEGVELTLLSRPTTAQGEPPIDPSSRPPEDEPEPEVTHIAGRRMDLRERPGGREENRYDEIRIYESVRATFARDIELETEYLVYENGQLSTDAGVVLRMAGLVIHAAQFRYDPETELGIVRGRHPDIARRRAADEVRIRTDGGAAGRSGAPVELEGRAAVLEYDAASSAMTLRQSPQIDLPEVSLIGNEIALEVDEDSNRVRRLAARGNRTRLEWLGAEAPGEHLLQATSITIELSDDGVASRMTAASPDSFQPRFDLGRSGTLRGDVIELLSDEGGNSAVVARGSARYVPANDNEMLRSLEAGELRTDVGADGVERLTAGDGVEITVATGDGQTATLGGPGAVFAFGEGDLSAAEWASGVRYSGGDTAAEAAHGAYDAVTRNWVLDGDPAPRMFAAEYDITAAAMVVQPDGGAALSGGVSAGLRGDLIASVAPLFGGADEIGAQAGFLDVGTDGRLTFRDNVRVTQGDQLLRADQIVLLPSTSELTATGGVLVSIANRGGNRDAEDAPDEVIFLGDRLLVSGSPPELRLVGNASLDAGERKIEGNNVTVQFSEAGDWQSILVEGAVTMIDPAGQAEGARLEYDSASGVVMVIAPPQGQAVFTNSSSGIDIRDPQALRLEWTDGTLSVTAMQKGTTQTVRSGG